jgi:uncharacterized membrane protein
MKILKTTAPILIISTFTILAILLFTIPVFAAAEFQYYGIDATIDESGRTAIKLTLNFKEPQNKFEFNVLGRVENLRASSIAGPVNCEVQTAGISFISCTMNLTPEKRTVELNFETKDFVKNLDKKFYFDAELSLNSDIEQVYASVKLPEGMVLYEGDITTGRLSFSENATTITDGRRIIIIWQFSNFPATQPLRLQFLYEGLQPQPLFSIRLRYFIALGVGAIIVIVYIIYRYKMKRPERLVLSVLDEFERKVVDIISAHGGTVNQKRIVVETNLSKAKISRVVKSLEGRGLVEVERVGRTNIIKLVKKKLSL